MASKKKTQEAVVPTPKTTGEKTRRVAVKKSKGGKGTAEGAKSKLKTKVAAKPATVTKSTKKAKKQLPEKGTKSGKPTKELGTAKLISSTTVYEGKVFRVVHDKLLEPGGKPAEKDVVRHNGSVVILAVDSSQSKRNPYIVIERQYRHAAGQFLWELPAGKLLWLSTLPAPAFSVKQ
jgi:hypothetical protein